MNKNSKGFANLFVLVVIILGAIAGIGYLAYKSGQAKINPEEKATVSSTLTPTIKIHWDNYLNASNWIYFNNDYRTIPERDFRFKYPKIFNIENIDSGAVELSIDSENYLYVEEFYINLPINSLEEKIKYYYQHFSDKNEKIPADYFKIQLTRSPALVYKIVMNGSQSCGGGSYNKEEWYCYVGNYKKSEFAIAQVNEIPNGILSSLIESIEFK